MLKLVKNPPIVISILCVMLTLCLSLRGIQEIVSTSHSKENVTIQYSHDKINGTVPVTVAQVQFLALTPGPRQICLNASDV